MAGNAYTFRVVCTPGLEPVTERELSSLSLTGKTRASGVVEFTTTLLDGCRATHALRTAERVRLTLAQFPAPSAKHLTAGLDSIAWKAFIAPHVSIDISATTRASRLASRDLIERVTAERVLGTTDRATLDPLVDDRSQLHADPANQACSPPVAAIVVRIEHNACSVLLDVAGQRLDRRGYRLETGPAPLREHVAAALLIDSGFAPDAPVIDPMCGSGTFAIEAALMVHADRVTPLPGSWREWPIWNGQPAPDTSRNLPSADEAGRTPVRIIAADRNAGAVGVARRNATRACVADTIRFMRADFDELRRSIDSEFGDPGLLILNPPYGKRVQGAASPEALYRDIGRILDRDWQGWKIGVLAAAGTESHLGLSDARSIDFRHGGMRCRMVCTTA